MKYNSSRKVRELFMFILKYGNWVSGVGKIKLSASWYLLRLHQLRFHYAEITPLFNPNSVVLIYYWYQFICLGWVQVNCVFNWLNFWMKCWRVGRLGTGTGLSGSMWDGRWADWFYFSPPITNIFSKLVSHLRLF